MLEPFGPSFYVADGPTVPFFGFPYPTRMAVARLSDSNLWVWSPVSLTEGLASAVEAIGPVRYILSPNKIHHLFLSEWAEHWPDAHLYTTPGLARKKPDLYFNAELGDEPYDYLRQVFTKLPTAETVDDIEAMLPFKTETTIQHTEQ